MQYLQVACGTGQQLCHPHDECTGGVTHNCNYSVLFPILSNGFNYARRTQMPTAMVEEYRNLPLTGPRSRHSAVMGSHLRNSNLDVTTAC